VSAADAAIEWLLDEGLRVRFLEDVFTEVCERLRGAGLPLDRATLHIRALHPQFRAVRIRWAMGGGRAELRRVGDDILASAQFLKSPVKALFEGAEGLRQRLDVPLPADAYAIYGELKERGFTDYVAWPLNFSSGQRIASTWSTRRSHGWRTDELMELDRLRPLLAMAAEVRIVRRTGRNIAETYLGRRAGARVLDGQIHRGDIETVDAVIAYLDMRDFTSFSERTASADVIRRLNGYFDVFGAAIEGEGGEILKFLGDGVLAIFPVDGDSEAAACRAVDAGRRGFQGLAALNAELHAAAEEQIACGLGLHLGSVAYGNIGTADRLDFTVIGPAVNLAARLQLLARDLGEPIVMTEEVAAACRRPVRSLGRHGVRGVPRVLAVYAPASEEVS
jgi:adenylate cyclase